jgi:hypothetical protein
VIDQTYGGLDTGTSDLFNSADDAVDLSFDLARFLSHRVDIRLWLELFERSRNVVVV